MVGMAKTDLDILFPQIYVVMHCAYLVFDVKPGFRMGWSWLGLLSVLAGDIFITLS
jgi:hypothetical protein